MGELVYFFQQLARSIFGSPNVGVVAPSFLEGNLRITDTIIFPYKRLFILLIAIVSIVAVYLLMYKTRQGRNIRASMQNRSMAASLGVNTKFVDAGTLQ